MKNHEECACGYAWVSLGSCHFMGKDYWHLDCRGCGIGAKGHTSDEMIDDWNRKQFNRSIFLARLERFYMTIIGHPVSQLKFRYTMWKVRRKPEEKFEIRMGS